MTIWEVQIKRTLGRLRAPRAPHHALCRDGVLPLPITDEHALRIGELPPLHRHPFERMLVAQALVEGAAIVSADRRLAAYGVEAPW